MHHPKKIPGSAIVGERWKWLHKIKYISTSTIVYGLFSKRLKSLPLKKERKKEKKKTMRVTSWVKILIFHFRDLFLCIILPCDTPSGGHYMVIWMHHHHHLYQIPQSLPRFEWTVLLNLVENLSCNLKQLKLRATDRGVRIIGFNKISFLRRSDCDL